jgi:glycosyltransferase involved in cell wall biosynthesis
MGLRLDNEVKDPVAPHLAMIEKVFQDAGRYDVIHFHVDYLHFPLSRRVAVPQLTTMHGRLDMPELQAVYREFSEMPLVSVSDQQREPAPYANWVGTVHHGIPEDLHAFRAGSQGYLAYLGRLSREKRADRAIEIARRSGKRLRIMGKVDPTDAPFFASVIEPLLDDPLVEFLGEADESAKDELLGNADALLFPIDWPEPFGMVMIEALACGTPVIAYPNGSVPEVLEDGLTGFLVNSVEEAVRAVPRVSQLDRAAIRRVFEERFSVGRMVDDYLRIYRRLVAGESELSRLRRRQRSREDERAAFIGP